MNTLDALVNWLRINYKDILRIITIGFIGLIALLFISVQVNESKQDRRQLEFQANQKEILSDLAKQANQRDKNVQKLIQDNAQQTLILCTIILSDSGNLSAQDQANIETICNRQIDEIIDDLNGSAEAAAGGTSQGNASSGVVEQRSFPQSAPNSSSAQPNNSQTTPPPPPEPDNEGIIIDILPILPPIRIPSPF